ncbi:UNVERIFIED_CONTAM: hypothetical protein Sindi_1695300, partial [Sesamum indicum]
VSAYLLLVQAYYLTSAMATADYSISPGNDATSRGSPDPDFMQLQSSDHPGMVI